jgi:hypothetical protein
MLAEFMGRVAGLGAIIDQSSLGGLLSVKSIKYTWDECSLINT